jgi:hypothetical protein
VLHDLAGTRSVDRIAVRVDRLDGQAKATLEPGIPAELDRRPDGLVVGGGVVGLTVAEACRRSGLGRVVVLEQATRLAAAASGANGGAIAPDTHLLTDSAEFVAFARASRKIRRRLDAAWDGALGLWPARWLNIFPPGAAPLVSRQAPGIATDMRTPIEFGLLDAASVRDLEPDARLPEGGSAMLVDGQFGVNPQRPVAALARRAGQVAAGVRLLDVTVRVDRIVAAHTSAGGHAYTHPHTTVGIALCRSAPSTRPSCVDGCTFGRLVSMMPAQRPVFQRMCARRRELYNRKSPKRRGGPHDRHASRG